MTEVIYISKVAALRAALLSLAVILSACGGGGGSDAPAKQAQEPLTFESEEINLFIDETPADNALSGGTGTGTISYDSSDTSVATVNSTTGAVAVQGAGTTTITVTKAADDNYSAASGSYTITVTKRQQEPLIFESSVLNVIVNGPTFTNELSGGSGSGAISFVSSDESIVAVDAETGAIEVLDAGDVTITANKAADGIYESATAFYAIHSLHIIVGLDIAVGKNDTELTWQSQTGVINVYRSTDEKCDIDNYTSCDNSNMVILTDPEQAPVTDNFITVSKSAYLVFENESYRSRLLDIAARVVPFARRKGEQMISFAGKLWVFGGKDDSAGETGNEFIWYNDIWSSADGKSWTRETEHASFSARANHQVVEYNGDLYLIGGREGIGTDGALSFKGDVWKSADGVLWQQMTTAAPFTGGETGKAIVFNNKMWMIGGNAFGGNTSIWSSTNGRDWTEEVETAPFGPREGHALYVIDDKLMLLGGMGAGGSSDLKNDVWSTVDGVSWIEETEEASFNIRVDMNVIRYNDKLWLTGGHSFSSGYNHVFSSTDGITWSLVATDIIAQMNQSHSLVLHNGTLWIYSGLDEGYIWRSSDGLDWRTPVTVTPERQLIEAP